MPERRPDPDQLLDRVLQEEARARRGKLKIFFGACAGVGKTYAMLAAARVLREQGRDVVVGVAETHGRSETAALLEGMEVLPPRELAYRDRVLKEFDLDAALARRPGLILVDELAHSNLAGCRHPKRWQDIEELLAAGFDVYTTVNVQHLESLNDVVGGITGIRVRETVPDRVFDDADEVVIVDLPPDELLLRLKQGRIYLPPQAERAIRHFFRKGNLIALRELALRRTADRVDGEMRQYRREQSVAPVWQTRESLLVCVGPGQHGEKLVRGAARLAARLDAPWHAIYVETPKLQRLPAAARQHILKTLKLAQELGADTATLPGDDAAATAVDYARGHNLAKLLVGRARRGGRPWRRTFADRLGRAAPDLDVIEIARGEAAAPPEPAGPARPRRRVDWRAYAFGAAICAAATALAALLRPVFDPANIIMVFLLAVVLVSVRFGRGPAVLATLLSVALFDFFFVAPRFSFAVGDVQYLFTFAVMLVVALITSHLTTGLHYQARVAMNREQRARALYEMAKELSAALLPEQIAQIGGRFVAGSFKARMALLLADADDQLGVPAGDAAVAVDAGIARWAFDHGEAAGAGTDTLPGSAALYLPLRAPMRIRGVLVVQPGDPASLLIPEQRRLLDTFATLIAIAVERIHYVEIAQSTTVQIESERLRNSLLSALSHDLRRPLTTLMGLAEYLTLTRPPLQGEQRDVAQTLQEEARRMTGMVNNLLDMGRLQAGPVRLDRQWQPLEEVVGVALAATRTLLAGHRVTVALPPDLPLLEFDAVLLERVLFNLLENAGKYTPPGSAIEIGATLREGAVEIAVADDGPGLPAGMEERIFEKFTRGEKESAKPGMGLGLAICRAIVDAHGGRIRAERSALGGARFAFTLPLGIPPRVADDGALPPSEAER